MASEFMNVVLALRNVRQFVSDADRASAAVGRVGTSAEKAGKQAKVGWGGLAKWAGGAAAVYGAYRFIKGAASATEELGRSTLALNRLTGVDIQTGAEWSAMAKSRNISSRQLSMGFVTLSKQIEKTRAGTKKHNSALEQLGFTSKDAAIQQGNVEQVILGVSDALAHTTNPAKRAALTQQLFARTGVQLAPVLYKGSAALQDQLDMYGKYVHMGGKTAKSVAEEMQHQRELQAAYLGLQVQIGTALLPVMLALSKILIALADVMQPLIQNSKLLTTVIIALAAAFLVYKIAMITAAIASLFFEGAAAPIIGIVYLILIALLALGVGILLLVRHWDTIRKTLVGVFNWVKSNWPLLVAILAGPFAVAAVLIYKNFDRVKKTVLAVFQAVKGAVKAAVDYIVHQFDRLKSLPGKLLGAIPGAGFAAKGLGKVAGFFGQAGGVVPYRSPVLVGERGPELLSLPGGARITPLPASPFSGEGVVGPIVVHSQLVVDRKVLAEAVAQHTADRLARR